MKLFDPCNIGQVWLKNRLVMAPMSTNFPREGYVTDAMVSYYEERAKGGVGLIVVEDGIVDVPVGNHVKNILAVDHDRYISHLRRLTAAVHYHGARISVQLSHGGRRGGRVSKQTGCLEVTRGMLPVAPSAIAHPVSGQVVPRALTIEEIEDLTDKFASAATRVVEAGFDIISIHCAHMYLCGQFLSPWANKREDSYGGSLEGRMRFVDEVIRKIHEAVGFDVPLICRMNGREPAGGNSADEIKEIARFLEAAGVKGLHVSVGFGASIKDPNFIPSITPMRVPDNCIVQLAEDIKKAVSIPVIAVNKIKDARAAEEILQSGKADLVAMGRPLIADPYLPLKAQEGRFEEIRPCIYCCRGCAQNVIEKDASLACSTNPAAGREIEGSVGPAENTKKVLVLGAGPAGIQAASTAAERGHQVWLVEKGDTVGGQLHLASVPPGKQEIERFTRYLSVLAKKPEIHLELGRVVDQAWLEDVRPDVAILATGSDPMVPDIEGLRDRAYFTAGEVLRGVPVEGQRVVVVGGGQVGCEVAEFLSEKGKQVTVVEIMGDIAVDMPHISKLPLEMALQRKGVRIFTKTRVRTITKNGVLVEHKGEREFIQADVVVVATGAKPHRDGVEEIVRKSTPIVHVIGDRKEVKGILEAVRAGYDLGREL
jgi:2,4-dienoyl-CoA reductase (NADPH2)